MLTEVYGSKRMKDCSNLVCIPAYNVSTGDTRAFKKDYGNLGADNDKRCVDVALATAAAPTYFPIQELDDMQFADGGLWANNPTLVGLMKILVLLPRGMLDVMALTPFIQEMMFWRFYHLCSH